MGDMPSREKLPTSLLARDTAAYFDNLSEEAREEEAALEAALSAAAAEVNFDRP